MRGPVSVNNLEAAICQQNLSVPYKNTIHFYNTDALVQFEYNQSDP